MAVDQQEQLQHAERLLKQGKVEDALRQLRMLAKRAPNDMLTLNRVGVIANRRQFLTEGKSTQLFEMAGYLAERIARHIRW